MATWPSFSISAYTMVSRLYNQGIRPRTVIDVGANAGQFTIAALNLFDGIAVHAFEPVKECVRKLRDRTSKFKNVYIYPHALGAKQELAAFHVNRYSLASSLLKPSTKHRSEFPIAGAEQTTVIELGTLDQYFSNAVLAPPVLLKLDVQGAEKRVIEGGQHTLTQVDYVLMETSFTPMYIDEPLFIEMIEAMKTAHFNFVRPVSILKSPKSGEILQADILFKNAVKLSDTP
jgi:FkbM family methyltransferase